ncbi:MAG: hypothetical protein WDO24_14795 [Pseudomonadota bacterium]
MPLTLRDFAHIFFRFRWRAAVAFLLLFGMAAAVVVFLPRVYESNAALLVKFGREFVYRPEIGGPNQPGLVGGDRQGRGHQRASPDPAQPRSHPGDDRTDRTGEALSRLGDRRRPTRPRDVAARRFERAYTVRAIRNSSVIGLSFEHRSPEIAADVLS